MRILFTQVQEGVEDVWAVGILLQSLEMIDDVLQGNESDTLGPNRSLIGIDLVSYGHG